MEKTIQKRFDELKERPSDIQEHLQTLFDLSSKCKVVVELWVRTWLSTIALLAGLGKWSKLISYDYEIYPEVAEIISLAEQGCKDFDLIKWDTREIEIPECDLLRIDTQHDWEQLRIELERHWNKAKKYLAFHDIFTFGLKGETKDEWLLPAILDFLAENHHWKIQKAYRNNNWLLILQRKKY